MVDKALGAAQSMKQVVSYEPLLEEDFDLGIIGQSAPMRRCSRPSANWQPVTRRPDHRRVVGKELVARAIYSHSQRSQPYLAINCAAIPENLLENELFDR